METPSAVQETRDGGPAQPDDAKKAEADRKKAKDKDPNEDPKVRQAVRELQRTDQEVRAHEAAHLAAGGQYVRGGPTYSYRTGPDGKRYAVGGEVSIDTSPIPNDPEATLMKMQAVRRAATAPAKPSAQDMKVAAGASQSMAMARMQLAENHLKEIRGEAPKHAAGRSLNLRA